MKLSAVILCVLLAIALWMEFNDGKDSEPEMKSGDTGGSLIWNEPNIGKDNWELSIGYDEHQAYENLYLFCEEIKTDTTIARLMEKYKITFRDSTGKLWGY